ncbi:ABC transporter permease [Spirosoma sp. RP8]|uniref:ABC transporter permease n=1 Tax=Spirosoma liriopis TaxID=2937440 RepID=A0ABT0HNM1_9BACT|nr:ABC transporter permease [Spirosoma liriopis]MCK8493570.1 ABC transporter permease [Spirosoma liriopis]
MSRTPASPRPPRWAQRLLTILVAAHLQEEVLGDLDELFYKRLQRLPAFTVRLLYLVDILLLLHPRLWRRASTTEHTASYRSLTDYPKPFVLHPAMIRNYLKIATRNLLKNKAFSFINVLGLSLGMVCCLFIFLWVTDERSIDNFHANGQNLYTAYQTVSATGKVDGNYNTPLQIAGNQRIFLLEDAKKALPEIQHVVFYATGYELPWGHPETFQLGERKFKLEGSRASNDFFTLFSYPLLAGNAQTALKDIRSIAISRKMAELFFGNPYKAVGKTLRYENKLDLMVTAVFENLPRQSSLKFDFLLSWEAQRGSLEWSSNNFRTFVQLSDGTDPSLVEAKINRFLQPRLALPKEVKTQIGFQAIGDQYLHSTFVNGKPERGRIEYVRIFTGVALFILFIACINFMNLATAQSVKRAKEVGVRKVLGSTRIHLIGQFYSEALLLACLAMVFTMLSTLVLLPAFNSLTNKQIPYPFTQFSFWMGLIGLTFLTGMLAGSYPALFLSSLEPVRILKGILRFTRQSIWFRQGLTVFQFGLSIILLVATFVVSKQTSYVQNTHLGYNRDNLIYIRIEGELMAPHNYHLFKDQAVKMAGITMIDRSSEAPHAMGFVVDDADGIAETNVDDDAINWEGKPKNASVGFKPTSVGFDFVRLMNLTVVKGRDFSRNNATDSTDAFLVNEEAVRQMGMKQPLGKWISAWQKKGHIIGVLKDYHTHSLHEPIKPLIVDVKEYEYFGVILVRLQAGMTKQALGNLERTYNRINPNYPFVYQFLDQEYAKLYQSEEVMAKLTTVFTALAIAISCLGLFGLVMFSAQQRTKEIGVRKVLGASVASITALLSRDYLRLIFLAILIASPVAWYAMQHWLADFAYKISIEWWMFALAGLSAFVVASLPVGIQSIKAALVNPVKSIRSE